MFERFANDNIVKYGGEQRRECEVHLRSPERGLELIGKGGTSLFLEIYPGCQPHLVKLGRIYVNPPYHRSDKLESYPRYAHRAGGARYGPCKNA